MHLESPRTIATGILTSPCKVPYNAAVKHSKKYCESIHTCTLHFPNKHTHSCYVHVRKVYSTIMHLLENNTTCVLTVLIRCSDWNSILVGCSPPGGDCQRDQVSQLSWEEGREVRGGEGELAFDEGRIRGDFALLKDVCTKCIFTHKRKKLPNLHFTYSNLSLEWSI